MGFLLLDQTTQASTQVSNRFIDEYMPAANGSFVKVYLYLLRQISSPSCELSVEAIADRLSYTEADIMRALKYWEKQGIIHITEEDGVITELHLLPLAETEPGQQTEKAVAGFPAAPTAASAEPLPENVIIPKRQTYSPLQAEALKKDSEIDSCISMVEALMGTTLSDAHIQLILYLMSDLGFSRDLIITLYETALARGKNKTRYIEAIALDWAKKGIRTSGDAETEAADFGGIYKTVSHALGIRRPLAPAERSIIDKWETYHFAPEILTEACSRTVLQSGDANLHYTSKILADWHKKGVTTLKDIEECDKSYFRQKTTADKRITTIHTNKFQNFPQRDYSKTEYADLEKKLLHQ